MRKLLSVALFAISSLLGSPAGFAYDLGKCKELFGTQLVDKYQFASINTEERVSFGDDPYQFIAQYPLGYAVICWLRDGSVAVTGWLFVEYNRTGKIEIRFHRAEGGYTGITWSERHSAWIVTAKQIYKFRNDLDRGPYDQVQIRLFRNGRLLFPWRSDGSGWVTFRPDEYAFSAQ